ncbi:hypothetical protein [Nocardioides sp.]|uniref:hypothetical protein n=1 Tax=Nocardioides sp. TaxID=35761 RepID=UPI002ED037E9
MAEKGPGNDGPSLELPSFGFGRKRKSRGDAAAPPDSEAPEAAVEPGPTPEPEPLGPVEHPEPGEPSAGPRVTGRVAAILTGLVVGALLVGLVWGSLRLCEVARGTSSCGRPGFLVLLAILALLVVVGRVLLDRLGVADPGSTSLLGVGVVALVVLLFLTGELFEWWAALVVPAVSMAAYALAHWVSTNFVETPEDHLHR